MFETVLLTPEQVLDCCLQNQQRWNAAGCRPRLERVELSADLSRIVFFWEGGGENSESVESLRAEIMVNACPLPSCN